MVRKHFHNSQKRGDQYLQFCFLECRLVLRLVLQVLPSPCRFAEPFISAIWISATTRNDGNQGKRVDHKLFLGRFYLNQVQAEREICKHGFEKQTTVLRKAELKV